MPDCQLIPLTPEAKDFAELLAESLTDGHRMLARFQEGWKSGISRFDRPGEMMLGAAAEGRLIGAGGRSLDPYEDNPATGRVRHLYVAHSKRGSGVGRLLVAALLRDAAAYFNEINVRAPRTAFGFYEHLGFVRVEGRETVTHRLMP